MGKKSSKKVTNPPGEPQDVLQAPLNVGPVQDHTASDPGLSQSTAEPGPPPNDGSPTPPTAEPAADTPRMWTRLNAIAQNEFNEASKIIKTQIERLRKLIPPPVPRSSSSSKRNESFDIIKDIDEFYSALADAGRSEPVKGKNNTRPRTADQAEPDVRESITSMYDDFEVKLDSAVERIIRGGMSLVYGDENTEDDDAQPGGNDNESDLRKELAAKIEGLWETFEDVRATVKDKAISQSFSTVRKKDYMRLGIHDNLKPASGVVVCQKVISGLASKELIEGKFSMTWEEVLAQMEKRTVETIDGFWNILSEESTRLLVNDIKYCLVSAAVMTLEEQTRILCFPEFSLGYSPRSNASTNSVARKGTAVEVTNKHSHKTRLSGSTDYFTFSLAREDLVEETREERSRWKGGVAELYDRLVALWASLTDVEGFVIVEAKSPLTRLESHIPQVVAEAIALGIRTQKPHVPFCLTSGAHWTFGVVFCADNERWVRRTTLIPFRPTSKGILLIVALLLSWTCANPEELWKLLNDGKD